MDLVDHGVGAPMTHVVMWRLLETAVGRTAQENAILMKAGLETMRGRIPGMTGLDVGIDTRRRANSFDVVLICDFESAAALEAYHDHPAHVAVKSLVQAVRDETVIVDYPANTAMRARTPAAAHHSAVREPEFSGAVGPG